MQKVVAMAVAVALLASTATCMYDAVFPHHQPPSSCSKGCAEWADLAGDGNTRSQSDVNAKWSDDKAPDDAGRHCAMPANDPDSGDSWCYCKESGDASWGSCTPPKLFPSEIAAYPATPTDVVVVFVTLEIVDKPHPNITITPRPPVVETWSQRPVYGTAILRHFHYVHLGGLQPNTTYTYRVTAGVDGDDSWSDECRFRTLPPVGVPTKFAIWGDMGVYSYNNMDSVIAAFDKGEIDFAAHIGDHGYNIGETARGDGYFDGNEGMYTKGLWVPGVGNHEFYDFDLFARYDTYTAGIGKYSPSKTNRYYSLDVGLLHLVVLDSTSYFGQPGASTAVQLEWLEADLRAVNRSQTPWVMMTAHHPLYCSSITYFDDDNERQVVGEAYDAANADSFQGCVGSGEASVAAMRADWEPLMLKYGVDLYMCGHEHNYESIYPVKDNTLVQTNFTNPAAPVHVVSGAGGAPALDKFGPPGPWTRKQINDAWSHSRVEVRDANTLVWTQYYNSYYGGHVADQFTIVQEAHKPFVSADSPLGDGGKARAAPGALVEN